MVAAAEANGVYPVKVTGIVADLGILGGQIKVEATKAKATSISAWLGQKAQGLWDTANDVVGWGGGCGEWTGWPGRGGEETSPG